MALGIAQATAVNRLLGHVTGEEPQTDLQLREAVNTLVVGAHKALTAGYAERDVSRITQKLATRQKGGRRGS